MNWAIVPRVMAAIGRPIIPRSLTLEITGYEVIPSEVASSKFITPKFFSGKVASTKIVAPKVITRETIVPKVIPPEIVSSQIIPATVSSRTWPWFPAAIRKGCPRSIPVQRGGRV
ncbi:unnamed protein product [Rhizoctonia solani]|uniref:Uncharacterized protein n=1 Tax=Rhizoctonia solani TaxID=456999 RepID=A0A8H2WGI3_9AGAM|nr:unnamed protein product [Rhizoctonia solani]